MTQEQVFEIGRIMLAGQNLKVGEAKWLWLPDTGHFFEGYITFRDGDTAHVWVGPFTEKLRRPDGPLDPDDPHTQIAFWNGGAWDTDLEKSPDDDRYPHRDGLQRPPRGAVPARCARARRGVVARPARGAFAVL
jgi:hypothetical protein